MTDSSPRATKSHISLPVALGFPPEDSSIAAATPAPCQPRRLRLPRNFSYPFSPHHQSQSPVSETSGSAKRESLGCSYLDEHCVLGVDIDEPFVTEAISLRERTAHIFPVSDDAISHTHPVIYHHLDLELHGDGKYFIQDQPNLQPPKKRGVLFGSISSRISEDSTTPLSPRYHKRAGSLLQAISRESRPQHLAHSQTEAFHGHQAKSKLVIKKKQSFSRRHRITRSVDLSHLSFFSSATQSRPVSSSGVSELDKRARRASKTSKHPPPSYPRTPWGNTASPLEHRVERFVRVSDYWFGIMEPRREEPVGNTHLSPVFSNTSSGIESDEQQHMSDGHTSPRREGVRPGKGGKTRWRSKMHKMTDWLTTSEPSTNALKQHRKTTFEKAGVSPNDPQAKGKLHLPIGDIPPDAIRPAGRGPSPEEIVKRQVEQRRKLRQSCGGQYPSRSSNSSSGFSDVSPFSQVSFKDHFPFDGRA